MDRVIVTGSREWSKPNDARRLIVNRFFTIPAYTTIVVGFNPENNTPGGADRFLLFFEDVGAGLDSDWDFNDLVVELTVRPGVNAVPLPPAAWSGLAALATVGAWRSRKRLGELLK